MAIHKIEEFFCIDIKKYPSLPPNSDLVQNWSIVLAYLYDANPAPAHEPRYLSDCEKEVDRAEHPVSSFFSIPLKDPSLGHFIAHEVCPETRHDIVLSSLRKTIFSQKAGTLLWG